MQLHAKRLLALIAALAAVIVAALALYLAVPSLLRERQPLIRACQTALEYLTASTTATRTTASEGPARSASRDIVRLEFEFRDVFAGQRPGRIVCEFAIVPDGQAPQLQALQVDGDALDSELITEINNVLVGESAVSR